jgi:hypothetical protein
MILETAISAMSDLFCDQFGLDSTFRMAVEDQSPDAAVGRMERRRNGRGGETRRVSPDEGNEAIFDLRVKTQLTMLRFNGLVNRIGGPTDAGELVLV